MNILQINATDIRGGAGKVGYDLHKALKKAGHNAKMLVRKKLTNDPDVISIHFDQHPYLYKAYELWIKAVDRFERYTGLQYFFMTSARHLLKMDIVKNADVIHVHNTHHAYLNLWIIGELSKAKPLVWTLHDMWPFTGHCAHSLDCDKWKTGCGQCPALKAYPPIYIDTTRWLWKIKCRSYNNSRFILVTPSKWLLDELSKSMLSDMLAYVVPNAVDTDVFHGDNKSAIRDKLELPQDKFLLTFVSHYGINNPWKGFNYLSEALSIIKRSGKFTPYLVVIGNRDNFLLETIDLEGRCVGVVKDMKLMADYYAASDAFLLPSIAENSPLVVLESMACGTPVVAFDVGGVPELVKHKENGYVAGYKDSEDFARGIRWLMSLDKQKYMEISHRCVALINERHTLKQQVENYLNVYNEAKRIWTSASQS